MSKSVLVGVVLLSILSTVAISQVFSVVTDGGNPFDALWEAISGLESRVETLEEQTPPLGFMTAPAYDSGWVAISHGSTNLIHELGTKSLFVYMIGRYEVAPGYHVHQLSYGLDHADGDHLGADWVLIDDDAIQIIRGTEDVTWEEVRVYIWIIP